MSTEFQATPYHPVLPMPTPEQAAAMGPEAWSAAMVQREKTIREEKFFPLWKSWEPPIWKVCDALWGAPWLDDAEADAIRLNLGFEHPINVLYLLGGQRSSKTEYAANRMSRISQRNDDGLSWVFHNTVNASIDAHQKLFWKFLPQNLRGGKPILTQTTYIAYKDKTGFSDGSFVLPNLHKMRFLSYDMDLTDLQGYNCDAVWGDEFVTPEHVDTFKARVAVKNGPVFVTLAPIMGYTPLVKTASDGAVIVREIEAFLNPADKGGRHIPGYLGLADEEMSELRAWLARKQSAPHPQLPWCRPEDCSAWLRGESGQPPVPAGRKFKKSPRIQRPHDPEGRSAIVHFNGSDNPYGNPISLVLLNSTVNEEKGNQIFYGVAKDAIGNKFPKFSTGVHVVPDEAIPGTGTNYMFEDPAGGRNPFRTWIRVCGQKAYVTREWPGNYEIPEIGIPGPWAVVSGKKGDGTAGPAQSTFGMGLLDLKREVARVEGWHDCVGNQGDKTDQKDRKIWSLDNNKLEEIKQWFPEHGTREVISRRFLDSRAASSPHIENDRPVTLLENYADIGMFYELTPGDDVDEGVMLINDMLSYDDTRPVNGLNCPRLYIAKSCVNTIFALQTWRNQERSKGATKDPIDNLRYFTLLGLTDLPANAYDTEGGGSY